MKIKGNIKNPNNFGLIPTSLNKILAKELFDNKTFKEKLDLSMITNKSSSTTSINHLGC
jgi:hypothetical protein